MKTKQVYVLSVNYEDEEVNPFYEDVGTALKESQCH